MAGVLDGVRVIEVSTWAALPGAGAILSDWGADVTKVEDPSTGGDPVRGFNLTPTANGSSLSPTWEQDNRNKKSVTINVRAPEGREALLRLLSNADVFLTSTRPKSLEQMRLSWEHLKEHFISVLFRETSYEHLEGRDTQGIYLSTIFQVLLTEHWFLLRGRFLLRPFHLLHAPSLIVGGISLSTL